MFSPAGKANSTSPDRKNAPRAVKPESATSRSVVGAGGAAPSGAATGREHHYRYQHVRGRAKGSRGQKDNQLVEQYTVIVTYNERIPRNSERSFPRALRPMVASLFGAKVSGDCQNGSDEKLLRSEEVGVLLATASYGVWILKVMGLRTACVGSIRTKWP